MMQQANRKMILVLWIGLAFSLSAHAQLQISQLTDIDLGTLNNQGGSFQKDINVCMYNSAGPNYIITATNNGSSAPFTLSNGVYLLPYSIKWNDMPNTQTSVSLQPNAPSPQNNASQSLNCDNTSNANIQIIIDSSEIAKAYAGTYTGQLQLILEPA